MRGKRAAEEKGVGDGVAEVEDRSGRRYKNREKWRNAAGEKEVDWGRRIKGSGRGRWRARKTRSRAGQKD